MKKKVCILLIAAFLLTILAGCGSTQPAVPVVSGGSEDLISYLTGGSEDEFLLTIDAEIDLTGAVINGERTVRLSDGVKLGFVGVFTATGGHITVRAEAGSGVLDLSALNFELDGRPEETLFDVYKDVELVSPAANERLRVNTGEEWTSVMTTQPPVEGYSEAKEISSAEELLQAFSDSGASNVELTDNVSVQFGSAALVHDLAVSCNGHKLTLAGELNMQGGILDIGDGDKIEDAVVDVSGLKVSFNADSYSGSDFDILFIGLNFKQIIGEPTLDEGLVYEIPDDGSHASVKIKDITTPEMHEAKLQEDMTQYLSGVDFPGGVGIRADFLADGVLEIELDNPTITKVIGVRLDAGMTLILTGSVTFDGGNYGFELHDDSTGTATVDITGLQINGTEALGDTRSPDIFMARDNVEIKFDESDPHIEVVENDRFWLRYVQKDDIQ